MRGRFTFVPCLCVNILRRCSIGFRPSLQPTTPLSQIGKKGHRPSVSYRTNRRNPFREDGISLLGRETPAFILEEVRKRQSKDRGTSSLKSKLAADYGWRQLSLLEHYCACSPPEVDAWRRACRTANEDYELPPSTPLVDINGYIYTKCIHQPHNPTRQKSSRYMHGLPGAAVLFGTRPTRLQIS